MKTIKMEDYGYSEEAQQPSITWDKAIKKVAADNIGKSIELSYGGFSEGALVWNDWLEKHNFFPAR